MRGRTYGWYDVLIAVSMLLGLGTVLIGMLAMIVACAMLLFGAVWNFVLWAFS